MKLKEFLKSTAFKCILVLLAISLVSGGLLSILNDVLKVSDDERLQRVIAAQYSGKEVSATEIEGGEREFSFGSVELAYTVSDGSILVKASGKNGFHGGEVTAWVIAEAKDGTFYGIRSASLAEADDSQSLIGNLSSAFWQNYGEEDEALREGKLFSTNSVKTGDVNDNSVTQIAANATYTSRAANNAVNAAVEFVKAYLEGGKR